MRTGFKGVNEWEGAWAGEPGPLLKTTSPDDAASHFMRS